MFDKLIVWFADYFNELNSKGKDGYCIINGSVPCTLLSEKYSQFIKEGISPIEKLTTEKKKKYFNIAKQYFTEKEEQIKASKAAYILDLITSND